MSRDGLEQAIQFALTNFWLEWWWLVMAIGTFLIISFGHLESRILLWRENRRLSAILRELKEEADEDNRWRKFKELTPVPFNEIELLRFRECIRICIAFLAVIAFLLAAILQQLIYRY